MSTHQKFYKIVCLLGTFLVACQWLLFLAFSLSKTTNPPLHTVDLILASIQLSFYTILFCVLLTSFRKIISFLIVVECLITAASFVYLIKLVVLEAGKRHIFMALDKSLLFALCGIYLAARALVSFQLIVYRHHFLRNDVIRKDFYAPNTY